jgi:hypothetical protein
MKPERRPLLVKGNMHLGGDFWTFSLPARKSCKLGMTEACEDVCYALDFVFITPSAKKKHGDNWERAQDTAEFASDLYAEIRYRRVKRLRIHVAGDFFSVDYLKAWTWVASRCKTTRFLFYTRAWRDPAMREPLIEISSLPNVFAFWSEDRETGPCDIPVGRRCFLCTNLQDELLVPPGVLVFRHKTATVAKFLNGSWVCAKEQGTKTGVTCSSCEQCVKSNPWPVAPEGRERGGSASETKDRIAWA